MSSGEEAPVSDKLRELSAKWHKDMESRADCDGYDGDNCGDHQSFGMLMQLRGCVAELDAALAAGDGAGLNAPPDAPADTLGPPNWAERAEPEATHCGPAVPIPAGSGTLGAAQPGERDRLREVLERLTRAVESFCNTRSTRKEVEDALKIARAALSASAPGVQGLQAKTDCEVILRLMGKEPYLAKGHVEDGEYKWTIVADKVSVTEMLRGAALAGGESK